MTASFPKIYALNKPASPTLYGLSDSPIGYFLAAWQISAKSEEPASLLVRLTLLPAHAERDIAPWLAEYGIPDDAERDDKKAKQLVKNHLFPQNRWLGRFSEELALGFSGTDFQHKVMKQMLRIGHGKTVSYAELAAKAGKAGAARAAASVCARNPLPFIVPCHRILTSTGTLGGYGYGTALKRQLLDWEKQVTSLAA